MMPGKAPSLVTAAGLWAGHSSVRAGSRGGTLLLPLGGTLTTAGRDAVSAARVYLRGVQFQVGGRCGAMSAQTQPLFSWSLHSAAQAAWM